MMAQQSIDTSTQTSAPSGSAPVICDNRIDNYNNTDDEFANLIWYVYFI